MNKDQENPVHIARSSAAVTLACLSAVITELILAHSHDCSLADFVQGTLNVATANKQEYHDTKTCNLASCRLYCTIYSTVCKPHCTRIYMTYFKLTNILDSTIQYIAKQSSFHFCFGTLLDRHYKCYVSTVSKSTDSHPTQLCVH